MRRTYKKFEHIDEAGSLSKRNAERLRLHAPDDFEPIMEDDDAIDVEAEEIDPDDEIIPTDDDFENLEDDDLDDLDEIDDQPITEDDDDLDSELDDELDDDFDDDMVDDDFAGGDSGEYEPQEIAPAIQDVVDQITAIDGLTIRSFSGDVEVGGKLVNFRLRVSDGEVTGITVNELHDIDDLTASELAIDSINDILADVDDEDDDFDDFDDVDDVDTTMEDDDLDDVDESWMRW